MLMSQYKNELFKLNESKSNRKLYWSLVGHHSSTTITSQDLSHPTPAGYRIIRVSDRETPDSFEIAMTYDIEKLVIYYSKINILQNENIKYNKGALISTWVSMDFSYKSILYDLPDKIFFDYMLKKYDIFMFSNHQVGCGLSLWFNRIYESLARGLNITHIMKRSNFTVINDQKAVEGLNEHVWIENNKKSGHLVIISQKELPAKKIPYSIVNI